MPILTTIQEQGGKLLGQLTDKNSTLRRTYETHLVEVIASLAITAFKGTPGLVCLCFSLTALASRVIIDQTDIFRHLPKGVENLLDKLEGYKVDLILLGGVVLLAWKCYFAWGLAFASVGGLLHGYSLEKRSLS